MPSAQLACGLTATRDGGDAAERGAAGTPLHALRSPQARMSPGMTARQQRRESCQPGLGEKDLRGTSSHGWLETATLSKVADFRNAVTGMSIRRHPPGIHVLQADHSFLDRHCENDLGTASPTESKVCGAPRIPARRQKNRPPCSWESGRTSLT